MARRKRSKYNYQLCLPPVREGKVARMNVEDALCLYDLPLSELAAKADSARREHAGEKIALCAIVNAKSGRCGQDCKFCAQSARYGAGAAEYPLKPLGELVEAARRAKETGSDHFGIVTSGKRLTAG